MQSAHIEFDISTPIKIYTFIFLNLIKNLNYSFETIPCIH